MTRPARIPGSEQDISMTTETLNLADLKAQTPKNLLA
ncbi:hypothetical protein MGSAQ_003361, partial [marine sediment metagenome]